MQVVEMTQFATKTGRRHLDIASSVINRIALEAKPAKVSCCCWVKGEDHPGPQLLFPRLTFTVGLYLTPSLEQMSTNFLHDECQLAPVRAVHAITKPDF
jgi:hypothetical protein